MRNLLSPVRAGFRRCLLLLLLLAAAWPAAAVVVDLNSDGVSDIWAMKYGVTGFSATADTDGDGLSDAAEAFAGTDPYDANSTVLISAMSQDVDGQHFTFPTLLGKGYLLQKSPALSPPGWVAEGTTKPGTGEALTVTIPAAGAAQYFYRVVVQDLDSDGDGVNDWEEITLGFDPKNAYSNGLSAANDLATITAALGATNVVSVTVADSSAAEPPVGQPATQTGAFQIHRSGNLNAITVHYTMSGSAVAGTDYAALSGTVTLGLGVQSATVTISPLADAIVESPEAVLLTISPNAAYTVGSPAAAALLIDDYTTANGTGVTTQFWNNTSPTIPVFTNTSGSTNGSALPVRTQIDPDINYTIADTPAPGTSPAPGVNGEYFVTRFTADVLPEFSQIYTFQGEVQRGGRLWVNGQLLFSAWAPSPGVSPTAGTYSGTIELQAGQRASVVFEHMSRSSGMTAILSWQSTNQPLQVIPQNRLFPSAPPMILSSLELLLIKGSPATTYQITATNSPTSYGAANMPPGWTINTSTGLISGSPTVAGTWPIVITATNAQGSGSAILNLTVIETGGGITRDVWSGTYAALSALPLTTTPTSTGLVSALEGPLAPGGGDYGSRMRGYLVAPQTGVYKFWIAGSDSAELWISDDDEPINLFRRASTAGGTGYRDWTNVNTGKSPLLILQAAHRYAVEVRHVDAGANGHVSIGWLKPGEGGADPANVASPSEVVPGYALSPYAVPAVIDGQSTLFATSMTAQGGAVSSGYGSASLRLSADESQAILIFTHANLTSPLLSQHIHSGVDTSIIFDIDAATPNPDGSYTWHIAASPPFSTAQIRDQIKAGNTYINIHTAFYPAGEIKGFFKLQAAFQSFTPPPSQTWSDPGSAGNSESALNRNGAARFLVQSTFGASEAEIQSVQSLGFAGWINNQINQVSKPITSHYAYVFANRNQTDPTNSTYTAALTFNAWWRNSVTGPDQLRQRVAFALSEIFVISENGPLDERADTISDYYDMLLANAFGNARTLLEDVTLHPAMGRYLDMLRNRRPDPSTGRIPNENYAREIEQLFSIGLYRMHPDGSLMLNSKGELIPTYEQDAIIGFAHVFTGWDYFYTGPYQTSQTGFSAAENWINPMREVPTLHFTGQKRLLNNVVLPGLPLVGGQPLDPNSKNHTAAQYNDPAYQALPALELAAAHDALFNHPNMGPFLCRQLIQRLVTSTPSRGYLYRVVQIFENNGSGVRGDMTAVIKAILLDYEARSASFLTQGGVGQQGYGKQREPVARVTALARAFPAPAAVSGTYAQSVSLITVNTGANHLYSAGNTVYLDFDASTSGDAGAPADATYTIVSVPTPTSFTVRTRSLEVATYVQSGASTKFSVVSGNNGFKYGTNEILFAEYLDGTPAVPASASGAVADVLNNELDLVLTAPTGKRATYSQSGSSLNIVLTANAHGYTVGTNLHIDFVSLSTGSLLPVSGLYPITAVTTNTFTITAAEMAARTGVAVAVLGTNVQAAATGNANLTRAADSATRSGPLAVTYSDWNMDKTETDLQQTPLYSPTVFNFFLPDYQFPGILGNAGLITPEFEITSETTVIRQVNFLYNGIFNDGLGQQGLSSFKSGARDIFVDLRPWMGIGPGGLPWAHNNNLNALIDELNTLLMAGQLPSTGTNNYVSNPRVIVNAKDAIRNYVITQAYGKTITAISTASPCVITANGHGLTNGQTVTIAGVIGGNFSAPINGTFTVAGATTNTFNVGINRLSGGTALGSLSGATATGTAGYSDQIRDRIRSVVHLLITSPDFTIQK